MTTARPRIRVITQLRFGGPEVLRVEERPRPVPAPGEVLVRVRAAGAGPVDAGARSGAVPLYGEPPFVLGRDVAGVVAAAGEGVTRFAAGDEVFGAVAGGGYAEYVTAPAGHFTAAAGPDALDPVRAAVVPTALLTAWQALIDVARIAPGTRVLVHAAAGGAGHVAVQLARAEGAYVIGTAHAGQHGFLCGLGVDDPVDPASADFATAVRDVDVALDLVGGDLAARTLGTLRPGALLVSAVPWDPGVTPEEVEARGLRFAVVDGGIPGVRLEKAAALLTVGLVRPHVAAALPFTEAPKAHELIESGDTAGGIVLVMQE